MGCTCWHSFSCLKTEKRKLFLAAGMVFTVISDYFLLVRNDCYMFAMLCFNLAQYSYFFFLNIRDEKSVIVGNYLKRLLTAAGIGFSLYLFQVKVDVLLLIVCHYFACLIWNAWEGWRKKDYILGAAFTLFLGCDICVGLSNMILYLTNLSGVLIKVSETARALIWVFYFPSQVLITIRSMCCKRI